MCIYIYIVRCTQQWKRLLTTVARQRPRTCFLCGLTPACYATMGRLRFLRGLFRGNNSQCNSGCFLCGLFTGYIRKAGPLHCTIFTSMIPPKYLVLILPSLLMTPVCMRQSARRAMFSESCSAVLMQSRRGVSAET
jgi:hypothetical protein